MGPRDLGRLARARFFELAGVNARARARLDGTCAVILTYHRVLPAVQAAQDAVEPGMFITPTTFARHAEWLGEFFRVLPLAEVAQRLASARPLPDGACALTFDDGWRDNFDHALPVLRRHQLPATLFVVSSRIGTQGAFWPDEVFRRFRLLSEIDRQRVAAALGAPGRGAAATEVLDHLKGLPRDGLEQCLEVLRAETPSPGTTARELVDWKELEQLQRAGVEIESHGASHAILPTLPDADLARELEEPRRALRDRGFGQHDLLAYPSGAHDARVVTAARAAGYRAAVTTDAGIAVGGGDPLTLPRVLIHEAISRTRAEFLTTVPGRA
jgi:peptidoglycan/xylan/chitin deacetylase (PgdA/CDA1 family)